MRSTLFTILLLLCFAASRAQVYKYIEKIPVFSLSTGGTYLVNSGDFGSFLKYYLPTNNGFSFYLEGTILYPTSSNYHEYRCEYGAEIVFFKIGGFSTHALAGFNYGWWQRKNEVSPFYNPSAGNHFIKDNSHFFGGGMDFEFNKNTSLYASWKTYPVIYSDYVEMGFRYNIYPREKRRRAPGKRYKIKFNKA